MKMITSKMLTIAVIAIVVVAGVGVAWIALGGSGKENVTINANLEVFGNANNDGKIDQADITLINDIIAGKASFGDYPLADANNDGKVDAEDVELVTRILNANSDNKVRIKIINHYDGRDVVVDVLYPITSAVSTGAANSLLIYKYLGICNEIKGLSWSTAPDSVLFSEFMPISTEAKRLETSATRMNVDKVSNLVDTQGITAAITADNRTYLQAEEPLLKGAGIDVVRVQPAAVDAKSYMSTVLMIAFLFDTDGKGYMSKCSDLIDWYETFLTDLNDKLKGIQKKAKAIAASSTDGVSTDTSDYTDVLRAAGAEFPITGINFGGSTSKTYNGTSDTWLNVFEIDYVMCIRTSTTAFSWYGGSALTTGTATLKTYMNNWRTLECYENNNVYVICGDMPVMLRIAYAAQTMYSDIFGSDYAYNLNVGFVKKFFGWEESMIKDKPFVVSMADLGLAS
ncbi:MAG: dockerin type I repeat-containing protein [Methanomassiliicoccaceae archaeon]|nr:dockerin type I repeat-containing protein [Methanomassiliicoccaceae archaeon]